MAQAAQVSLSWDANTDSVAGYKLHYGSASRSYTTNTNVGNTTTYTWTGLEEGRTYFFAATAYDASGNQSDYSAELVCHTISVASGAGGSISPTNAVFVASGGSQTFTISPSTGYRVSNVLVDGQSVGAVTTHTFSAVTAPRTISASFVPITYTITSSVTGSGGTITPPGITTVNSGSGQAYTITPDAGYKVSNVLVNGSSVGAVTGKTFSNVTSNQTISASFVPITYTITSSVTGSGGTITPSGTTTVNSGSSQAYAITPNAGYKVSNVLVNGSSVGAVTGKTFTNVTSNQTITASFAPITYTITSSVTGSGGTITPSGTTTVNSGGGQAYTITPNAGYNVDTVLVNGTSAGAVKNYTFTNVASNQTISASFKTSNEPPVADAGPDQTVPEGMMVTLKGSNSSDVENNIVSYLWEQIEGPIVQLSSMTVADPTFSSPNVGPEGLALTFRLTVTDGLQATSSDTCIVNISWINIPPVAKAGPDQTVSEWTSVTLDGSQSTDVDDGVAFYSWKQTAGPSVQIGDPSQPVISFVSPDTLSGGASVVFELTVTDYNGLKATDSCIVNASWVNTPPVSNAGADKQVFEGDAVVLDGTGSSDDDGITSYRWRQTQGTPATFDPASAVLQLTAPTIAGTTEALAFSLTVTDTSGLQSEDSCTVTISKKSGVDLSGAWTSRSYDAVTFKGNLQVRNGGNIKAGSFKVAFYLSNDGVTPIKLVKTASITGLAAGAAKNLAFSYRNRTLNGQCIIAVVDSTKLVPESNESNNSSTVAVPLAVNNKRTR